MWVSNFTRITPAPFLLIMWEKFMSPGDNGTSSFSASWSTAGFGGRVCAVRNSRNLEGLFSCVLLQVVLEDIKFRYLLFLFVYLFSCSAQLDFWAVIFFLYFNKRRFQGVQFNFLLLSLAISLASLLFSRAKLESSIFISTNISLSSSRVGSSASVIFISSSMDSLYSDAMFDRMHVCSSSTEPHSPRLCFPPSFNFPPGISFWLG